MKAPRFRKGTGALGLDIQVYLEVRPFVDPASFTKGVHLLFRVSAGHREGGEHLVFT